MKKKDTSSARAARAERRAAVKQERRSRFARTRAALCEEGYVCIDKTLAVRRASILGALVSLPLFLAVVIGGLFLPEKSFLLTGNIFSDAALFVLLLFASIPAHEGLHALGWAAAGGSFRGLSFGFAEGAPYCACERPLARGKYLCGVLLPFVLLGIGLSAAGLCARMVPLFVLGAFNVACAGGDMIVAARAAVSPGLLLDHPDRCGFYRFFRPKNRAAEQDMSKEGAVRSQIAEECRAAEREEFPKP